MVKFTTLSQLKVGARFKMMRGVKIYTYRGTNKDFYVYSFSIKVYGTRNNLLVQVI